ncbi:MAG: T9SS type A sorting domain-containing protein [Bacteroidales bacterium]
MYKIFSLLLVQFIVIKVFGQGLYNNGAKIIVSPGAGIYANGNLTNHNSGSISIAGMLTINGTLTNNATLTIENGGSLIDNGTINGSGTNLVKLNLTGNVSHYISGPVNNALVNVFTGAYVSRFDEPTSDWIPLSQGTVLNGSTGYSAFFIDNSAVNFTGTPGTGVKSVLLTKQESGWNLVGNPYPSSVDWDAPGWTKTNHDNSIYLWNGSTYAVYNGTIGVGINNATRYIPPMQGFFIRCNSTTGSLTSDNSVRVHNAQPYYKKAGAVETKKIKLLASANEIGDETLIIINQDATDKFEGTYDALKLFSPNEKAPQIYTSNEFADEMAINSLKNLDPDTKIPLGIKGKQQGEYSIKATEIELDAWQDVYLVDNLAGRIINLRLQPEYSFTYKPSDNPLRFYITFAATTGLEDIESKSFKIYTQGNNACITLPNASNNKLKVYNLLGAELGSYVMSNDFIKIPLSTGVYIISVEINGQFISKKLTIE